MRKNNNKKSKKIICALCAVLALCAALSSCSRENDFKISEDGHYVNSKTNIAYSFAPGCYEPIAIGQEAYGKINDVVLYKMGAADPEKWLCDFSGCVFYADGVELPALDGLNISRAEIVLEESTVEEEKLMTVSGAEVIEAIVDEYINGEKIYKPSWTSSMYDINWRLRFADEGLGLYYTLAYFELYDDYVTADGVNHGKRFLYNRFEDKESVIPVSNVLAPYVEEYRSLYVAK